MGSSILIASSLGFLGLGVPPPTPEWGSMIGSGRIYLFSSPHIVLFPGLFIMIAVLSFNLIGDGLRDALDPKMRTYFRRG
jgi:ABC-type dipeptide/oligopeptide/nickel transport system permease subunit